MTNLTFHSSIHRYRHQQRWIKWSISQIVDTRSDAVKVIHDKTREKWEPRGNTVHACLEAFLQGKPYDPGEYQDIVDPLVNYPLFTRWHAVACEYRMFDMSEGGGVAGSLDCILRHNETGIYALADLKTLSKSGRDRDISAQLGGYLSLLRHCRPEIKIDKCFGIWAKPKKTWTTSYNVQECIDKYQKIKTDFFAKQPQI